MLQQKGIHLHKPKTNNTYSNLANSIVFDNNNLINNARLEKVSPGEMQSNLGYER